MFANYPGRMVIKGKYFIGGYKSDDGSITAEDVSQRARKGFMFRLNPVVTNRQNLLINLNAKIGQSTTTQPLAGLNTQFKTSAWLASSNPEIMEAKTFYALFHSHNFMEYGDFLLREANDPPLSASFSRQLTEQFALGLKLGVSFITRGGDFGGDSTRTVSPGALTDSGTYNYYPQKFKGSVDANEFVLINPVFGISMTPSKKIESGLYLKYLLTQFRLDSSTTYNGPNAGTGSLAGGLVSSDMTIRSLYSVNGLGGGLHFILKPIPVWKAGFKIGFLSAGITNAAEHFLGINFLDNQSSANKNNETNLAAYSQLDLAFDFIFRGREKKIPLIASAFYRPRRTAVTDNNATEEALYGTEYRIQIYQGGAAAGATINIDKHSQFNVATRMYQDRTRWENNVGIGLAYCNWKNFQGGLQFSRNMLSHTYTYATIPEVTDKGFDQSINLGGEINLDSAIAFRLGFIYRTVDEFEGAPPESLVYVDPSRFFSSDLFYLESFSSIKLTGGIGFLNGKLEFDLTGSYELITAGDDFRFFSNLGNIFDKGGLGAGTMTMDNISVGIEVSKHF